MGLDKNLPLDAIRGSNGFSGDSRVPDFIVEAVSLGEKENIWEWESSQRKMDKIEGTLIDYCPSAVHIVGSFNLA